MVAIPNIEISKLSSLSEIESLREISIKTFVDTFSEQNTEENMQKYLDENLSIKKLSEEFNTPGSEFYFAKIINDIIGYLKINSGNSQTELKTLTGLEIERIYVLKEFHGKHIGQILLEKTISLAKEKKCDHIWLGVWEENARAISFYKKHGFNEFDKHIFKLGDDDQIDILMKLELNHN